MNGQCFEGICRQFAGKMKEIRGELTGDPLRVDAGRREQIAGKAQQASGMAREEAERQLRDFRNLHRHWRL